MTTIVIAAYYALLAVLALYGAHRLVLLSVLHRTQPTPTPAAPARWPTVTVQLPIFNEIYVAPRLLAAAANLDYPRELLEIQVLDDSTDETSVRMRADVEALRLRGLDVVHLTRADRKGFKAGALAAGLPRAKGDLVAVFDADFVPAPDFLVRAVPAFSDPGVGMVQTRWEHLNRGSSLLTRAQAVLLDGHFLIEHDARARAGRFFNFNGTAGVWRREAITSAGGWHHDTLTEDLDLSYRAQLAGWRFVFLPDIEAPAELPVSMAAFKGQQKRWTKGSVQTLRKLGRHILAAPLPLRTRLEAMIHLTSNLCYVLLVALATLFFPAMWLRAQSSDLPTTPGFDLALLAASTGAVGLFYLVSQVRAGRSLIASIVLLPAVMALGAGLSVHNAMAAIGGWFRSGGEFVRTPKYRVEKNELSTQTGTRNKASWMSMRYQAPLGPSTWIEVVLSVYLTACLVVAAMQGLWWATPFLALFLAGYSWVALAALWERVSIFRLRRAATLTESPPLARAT